MHYMVLAMREQMKAGNFKVKIIEILPPAVQTELHDHESGAEKGRAIGMPLEDFTNEAFEDLIKKGVENEQVPVQAVERFIGI
jgi:short-subunit dehydrogenase involved in D-alanine esterification of teichoic acids